MDEEKIEVVEIWKETDKGGQIYDVQKQKSFRRVAITANGQTLVKENLK
jgi:hypothetical protein